VPDLECDKQLRCADVEGLRNARMHACEWHNIWVVSMMTEHRMRKLARPSQLLAGYAWPAVWYP